MPKVKCHVDTCTHWLSHMCGAENIDILNESRGQMPHEQEQTECKTFHRKEGLGSYISSMDNLNWSGMAAALTGGDTNPSVTCVVDTCHYWRSGDECHADAIEVTGQGAERCQETDCSTYKQKS